MRPLALSTVLLLAACASAPALRSASGAPQVVSPDGSLTLSVKVGGPLTYAVALDGKPILADSPLGLVFEGGLELGKHSVVTGVEGRAVDTSWRNDFGKCSTVRDHFNETRIHLKEERGDKSAIAYDLVVRAYDDGVALRYDLPKQEALGAFVITRDKTGFTFPKDGRALGGAWSTCAECHYPETTLAALPESKMCLPVVAQTDAATVALAEVDVRDWSCAFLKRTKSTGAGDSPVTLEADLASKVVSQTPRVSPWHLAMVGRQPGTLIESNLMANLATPSQVADTSWVKPGVMAWDKWWSFDGYGNLADDKKFVDLASEMGWPYELVDWGWMKPGGPDGIHPTWDIHDLAAYAKAKGVKLVVWAHSKEVNAIGLERFMATCEKWGFAGVKIDFMDRSDQEIVQWYEKVLACAAKHRLLVDFHGAYVPTGLARTWPNYIVQEGILGSEYSKGLSPKKEMACDPQHHISLPFTRGLLGPGDFTPGGFLNRQPKDWRKGNPTFVMGTRARQLALATVIDAPLLCMADHPTHYRKKDGGFEPGFAFFRDLPTVWDETRVLSADLAKHLVEARRKGDQWVVAAMNIDKPLTLKVKLDFLGDGEYTARVFADKPESETKATEITDEVRIVKKGDTLEIPMASNGGFAARIAPKNP